MLVRLYIFALKLIMFALKLICTSSDILWQKCAPDFSLNSFYFYLADKERISIKILRGRNTFVFRMHLLKKKLTGNFQKHLFIWIKEQFCKPANTLTLLSYVKILKIKIIHMLHTNTQGRTNRKWRNCRQTCSQNRPTKLVVWNFCA